MIWGLNANDLAIAWLLGWAAVGLIALLRLE